MYRFVIAQIVKAEGVVDPVGDISIIPLLFFFYAHIIQDQPHA